MKKNAIRKLRLSRETLRDLQDSDPRKVIGGVVVVVGSTQSAPCCRPTYADECG